jgi:hypothetical protein
MTTEVMIEIQTPTCNLYVLPLPTEHHNVKTLLYIRSDEYTSTNYVILHFFNNIATINAVSNVKVVTNIYLESPIPCPLQDFYIARIAVLNLVLISPCFSSHTTTYLNGHQTNHCKTYQLTRHIHTNR